MQLSVDCALQLLQEEEMSENTRFFQLLRVTKQLQEMIKGGDDSRKAIPLSAHQSPSLIISTLTAIISALILISVPLLQPSIRLF